MRRYHAFLSFLLLACSVKPVSEGCIENAQCPAGQSCIMGACTNQTKSPCAGAQACTSTNACTEGRVCIDGCCGLCRSSADCQTGQICDTGLCRGCREASECGAGQACARGLCGACTESSHCLAGEACRASTCGDCTDATECVSGQACTLGLCGPRPGWRAMAIDANTPAARYQHSAVWSGSRMIVWGGTGASGNCSNAFGDGALYDPALNRWERRVTTQGAPAPRFYHSAIWAGAPVNRMIIWGGENSGCGPLGDGARYDAANDRWEAMAAAPIRARFRHATVWTGTHMIVWGGSPTNTQDLGDGAIYDPVSNTWTPIPAGQQNAPSPRVDPYMLWTGSKLIVWGGYRDGVDGKSEDTYLNDGAIYDPGANTWEAMLNNGSPAGRLNYSRPGAVWTGAQMVVWGGYGRGNLRTGGIYDLKKGWLPMKEDTSPSMRAMHQVLWTGSLMFVWGGSGGGASPGGVYRPITNTWADIPSSASIHEGYYFSAGVWTGEEILVWGGHTQRCGSGSDPGCYTNTGGRYTPGGAGVDPRTRR